MPHAWDLRAPSLTWPPHPPPPPLFASPSPPTPPRDSRLASNLKYFVLDAHPAVSSLAIGFFFVLSVSCVRQLVPLGRRLIRRHTGGHFRVSTEEGGAEHAPAKDAVDGSTDA